MPSFPTEPECLIRKRIGELRKQHDIWFDVDAKADEGKLISQMRENLERFILPYFDTVSTTQDALSLIEVNACTCSL